MKLIFTLIFVLITSTALGDEFGKYFQIKNQFLLPKSGINPVHCIYQYYKNDLYLSEKPTKKYNSKDYFIIYKMNANATEKYMLKLNEDLWLGDFSISDEKIILLTSDKLIVYKNELNPKNYQEISLNDMYESIFIEFDKIILTKSCFSCDNPSTIVAIYDLKTLDKISEKVFDNQKGFPMTYFHPKRIINYGFGNIAISDITNYSIRIYDLNYKLKNVINFKIDNWGSNSALNPKFEKMKDIDKLNQNMSYYLSVNSGDMIHFVDFLSPNELLVCRTSKIDSTNSMYNYDVWELIKGNWQIKYNGLRNPIYSGDDFVSYNNFLAPFNSYTVSNGVILMFFPLPFDLKQMITNKETNKSMKAKANDYFGVNDITGSVFIIKPISNK